MMQTRFANTCIAAWIVGCSVMVGAATPLMAATPMTGLDVFAHFTQHIQRQADTDKQAFAAASQCMNWFYKQLRQRPTPPAVQGIAWTHRSDDSSRIVSTAEEEPAGCRTRYPGGIEAVRTDFQRTQAFLSVSLTFYEFALVGDGDDNSIYSTKELQDVLLALNLSAEPSFGADAHLRSLTSSFDTLHAARGMEALMAGMGKLYDQGYRVTPADRAHLNRVME